MDSVLLYYFSFGKSFILAKINIRSAVFSEGQKGKVVILLFYSSYIHFSYFLISLFAKSVIVMYYKFQYKMTGEKPTPLQCTIISAALLTLNHLLTNLWLCSHLHLLITTICFYQ